MRRFDNFNSRKYLRVEAVLLLCVFVFSLFHSTAAAMSLSPEFHMEGDEMHVEDAPETDIIAFGKKVFINKRAKGVFVVGGDVVINGNVQGDVGVIGGSITQKKDAFIGGDILVIGGSYKPEIEHPLRDPEKGTVMLGLFEDEIREFSRDPSSLFTPTFSGAYVAQRLLSILFWFLISIGLTTISPGGISRAVARLKLSSLKIVLIGTFAMAAVIFGVAAGIGFLPNYLSGIVGLMAFLMLMLAYLVGRVTLHVLVGKYVIKHLFGEVFRSESLAILSGVLIWAIILSIPYLWSVGILSLFIAGVGLVLTARTPNSWSAD